MSDPIYFIKSAGGDVDGVIKDASVDMIYRSMEPTFVDGSVIDSGQLQDDSVGDVVNRTDYLPVEQDTTAYIVRGFDYNSSSFHANIGFYDADLNVVEVIPYNNSVEETVMLIKPPIGSLRSRRLTMDTIIRLSELLGALWLLIYRLETELSTI